MRDTERDRDIGRGRKSRLHPCREPNVGLDPRTLGSCPELKADAQPLSHPGAPRSHKRVRKGYKLNCISKHLLKNRGKET